MHKCTKNSSNLRILAAKLQIIWMMCCMAKFAMQLFLDSFSEMMQLSSHCRSEYFFYNPCKKQSDCAKIAKSELRLFIFVFAFSSSFLQRFAENSASGPQRIFKVRLQCYRFVIFGESRNGNCFFFDTIFEAPQLNFFNFKIRFRKMHSIPKMQRNRTYFIRLRVDLRLR